MEFVYPQFLYALFTVLIPVIIHLFSFRRFKKIPFSNVAFLKDVEQQTRSRSQLKHLLILLSRMMLISMLVLAFAQPFLPSQTNLTKDKIGATGIYIDNSFSMESLNEDGILLDVARQYGYNLLEAFPARTSYNLLTNALAPSESHFLGKNQMKARLGELSISSKTQPLSRVINRQKAIFDDNNILKYTAFIISDFQYSNTDLKNINFNSNTQHILLPLNPIAQPNVAVDSVWFEHPFHRVNQIENLHVRIRNYSQNPVDDIPLTLWVNGEQKAIGSVDIRANTYVDTLFSYTVDHSVIQLGKVSIEDHPVRFDNDYFYSYLVRKSINVLEISPEGKPGNIQRAFATEPYFNYSLASVRQLDYGSLAHNDLIVLNGIAEISSGLSDELQKFLNQGGSLVVYPAVKMDVMGYNNFLRPCSGVTFSRYDTTKTRIADIAYKSAIYRNVFEEIRKNQNLPIIKGHYQIEIAGNHNGEWLLKTVQGENILQHWECGRGDLYLSSAPLDPAAGNMAAHGLFLPTMFMMAFNSAPGSLPNQQIGSAEPFEFTTELTGNEPIIHVVQAQKEIDIIPEFYRSGNRAFINLHGAISEAGNYEIQVSGETISGISLNYDRDESDLSNYTQMELQQAIDSLGLENVLVFSSDLSDFTTDIHRMSYGTPLWRWFLLAALLFLAIEILLIRFIKPTGI